MTRPIRIAILAGEESGDRLGGAIMRALNARRDIAWCGVGGEDMTAAGLAPIFPMHDIAVMGIDAIIRRLPHLLGRIDEAARAVDAFDPDVLLIIDAPEFNHRVAKKVRRKRPTLPIANYVSPTVWAWRPGRAKAMRPYVDLILALFPFEPAAHARLGGPRCVYVGHPLYETMRALAGPRAADGPLLLLPGSRQHEVETLMPLFGAALGVLRPDRPVRLLAVNRWRARIEALAADWPVRPEIVSGEAAKQAAFAEAAAALAASGTVTLELAAARVPMVVAYKLDFVYRQVKRLNPILKLVTVPSMVLANIVIGRNAIPALLEDEATPEAVAAALRPLLVPGTPERTTQEAAFDDFAAAMAVADSPADRAAEAVLSLVR